MRHSAHTLFPLIALGVLAASSFWLERATRFESAPDAGQLRHDPDVKARDFTLRQFDAAGAISYILTGHSLTHFPDDQTVLLERPALEQYAEARTMTLSSASGEYFERENRVVLVGDVRGTRREPNLPMMTFASAKATVWPDEERIESQDAVTLKRGSSTITAGNMTATTLFGKADLGGGVHAELARKESASR